ncbi:MAG: hypothetical protein HY699_02445 [Deltaproteobacteria bacterium]|nr:hypothetical protein [Deltaproteobacteria bacterium]
MRHWAGGLSALAVLAWLPANPCGAAIEEVEATGRYHLGDNDSKLDGHRLALMEAKRNALEKAGTYVESISEVKDFQLTRDEVRTYTAGILEVTEEGEPKWQMVGSNLEVTVKVKVRVDKDDVARRLAAIRENKEAAAQLKEAGAKTKENERKIADLNRQLKTAKKGSPKAKQAQESRAKALADLDASALKAHAAVARSYSEKGLAQARAYLERNVKIRGCAPAPSAADNPAAAVDPAWLWLAAPAVALMIGKSRSRRG